MRPRTGTLGHIGTRFQYEFVQRAASGRAASCAVGAPEGTGRQASARLAGSARADYSLLTSIRSSMTTSSETSELPVSIDFYFCIGKIAVTSSALEKSVWWFLHYLRHYHYQPDLDGWEYSDEKTRYFDKKLKAIRSLMQRRGWATEEQEFVSQWLDTVASFREIRHDLVHSHWLYFGEDHSKYTLEARDWKFEDGPVELAALRARVVDGERILGVKGQVADLAIAYLWSLPPGSPQQ